MQKNRSQYINALDQDNLYLKDHSQEGEGEGLFFRISRACIIKDLKTKFLKNFQIPYLSLDIFFPLFYTPSNSSLGEI